MRKTRYAVKKQDIQRNKKDKLEKSNKYNTFQLFYKLITNVKRNRITLV